MNNAFERVYCVNLGRRKDRWQGFLERLAAIDGGWPFAQPQRYTAIDGKRCNCPSWFTGGGGAWGCYRSHLRIIERCLNEGVNSVLLLEDDATFCEDFCDTWERYYGPQLPQDWGMLYLGGQHLNVNAYPPRKINDCWYQPNNVNRTHAFALKGQTMQAVYKWLCECQEWMRAHHIDHHLGRFHHKQYLEGKAATHKIYTPAKWLIGQSEGDSNISGRSLPERFWPAASSIAPNFETPFVAVIGLHRSGSSCLAMCLHYLGIHMGNVLGGYEKTGGGEAQQLARICEQILPFPACGDNEKRWSDEEIVARLRRWSHERRREAFVRGCLAGAKYPHLCALAPQLQQAVGGADSLKVVHINRPLAESIDSLQRRSREPKAPRATDMQCQLLQQWLDKCKWDFLSSRAGDYITVNYGDLIRQPEQELRRVVEYLGIDPTTIHKRQWRTAIDHVLPRELPNPLTGAVDTGANAVPTS